MTYVTLFALLAITAQANPPAAQPQALTKAIAVQVALDRAGFSSGVIDGRVGMNTRRALDAYRAANGRDPDPFAESLLQYRITSSDAAGPFVENMPSDLIEQSKLPALSYQSVVEALAERFHTTPELLRTLNRGASFAAETEVSVPNVEPLVVVSPPPSTAAQADGSSAPQPKAAGTTGRPASSASLPDVVVRVSKSASSLTVTDASDKVVFFAPVTTGSENDPLPIGEWKVNGVQRNPTFRYNPALFWDADPTHTKAVIPSGPNSPVGLVWIDISKEHYGLHGSPEPSKIGRTQSHGCVRLTNWDALRLAGLVKPGTRVIFTE